MVAATKTDIRGYLLDDVGVLPGVAIDATVKYLDDLLADGGGEIEDQNQKTIAFAYCDGYQAAMKTIK